MRHSCLVANVLPDMRNAGLTGVSRRKSTEIGLNSSGCHGVVNLHARPNQKAFL